MSAVDFTGVLSVAPDGTPMATVLLVSKDPDGIVDFACSECGRQVSHDSPATARTVQQVATTHRCGGPTWEGVLP